MKAAKSCIWEGLSLRRWSSRVIAVIASGVFSSTALGAPHIFWASDPVAPDETVLVTGHGLDDITKVVIARIPDAGEDKGESNRPLSVATEPVQKSNESLKFVIPKSFPPGVFRFELIGKDGSAAGYLNEPNVYWVQGDQGSFAIAGGWIRIFGRNIGRSSALKLTLTPEGREGRQLTLVASKWSSWDASFAVPPNVVPGRYRVRLWNGQGDGNTWKDAGTYEIGHLPQPSSTIVNVKQFGAAGDGEHDDAAAIAAALRSLGNRGGGTLIFPRGRYLLSNGLRIPANVVLKGEARELVSLNWPEFDTPPAALLGGGSNFSIKDLTIYASNYATVISGGFSGSTDKKPEQAGNITIDNVRIRASAYRGHISPEQTLQRFLAARAQTPFGPATIRLSGKNLKIVNSDIYGSGRAFFLIKPQGAYIGNNRIYNGVHGFYYITAADGVIVERNEVVGADLQSTGGGPNTHAGVTFSKNILFFENKFSLMHGWDREALTSDGPGGFYYGAVEAEAPDRLRLVDSVKPTIRSLSGAGLFIVKGRGTGQYATVAQYDSKTLALDRPLAVLPDGTSIVTIVPMQMNYLIIGNTFSDAGVAVQFYGTSVDHVVAGNTSARTGGFFDKGLDYSHFQPSWHNQFLGNTISEGNLYDVGGGHVRPGGAAVGVWGLERKGGAPPLARGIVIRGNSLKNNAKIHMRGGGASDMPGIVDVVVENNHIAHTDVGIDVDPGTKNVLLRRNRFEDTRKAIQGMQSPGQ